MNKFVSAVALAASLSGCASIDQLGRIGKAPSMTPVDDVAAPAFEPSLAREAAEKRRGMVGSSAGATAPVSSASLFRSGAGALFHDQRAAQVGDILTVKINIADKAEVGNSTSRSRNGSENVGIASLLGLQNVLPDDGAVDAKSASKSGGQGTTSRSETINMTMAAIVTDVLPNGNLVIKGRQEMRVNFELRELIVTGIVRPQDIGRDNSIAHSQIAEARISYGGRGQLTDVQQARWGQQIYDALFPF